MMIRLNVLSNEVVRCNALSGLTLYTNVFANLRLTVICDNQPECAYLEWMTSG
jgi:hypothetical protein